MANEEDKAVEPGESTSGAPEGGADGSSEADKVAAAKYAKLREAAEEMNFEGENAVEEYLQFLEMEAANRYRNENNGGNPNGSSGEAKKPDPPEKKTDESDKYKQDFDNIRSVASAAIIESQYAQFMIEDSVRPEEEKCPFTKKELAAILHKPGTYQMAHSIAREEFGDNIWKGAEFILATRKGASKFREQGKNASDALKRAASTATTTEGKRQPGTGQEGGEEEVVDKQFMANVFPDNRFKGE